MADRSIVILTPTRHEAAGVRAALRRRGQVIDVVTIGVGGAYLEDVAWRAPLVLLAGLAGSLHPDYRPGDVLIQSDSSFLPAGRFRSGRLETTNAIISTPDEKRRLGAQTGCHAVDMEHDVVAAALGSGQMLVSIRAILDGVDETLPGVLGDIVDAQGRVRIGPLLGALARGHVSVSTLAWLMRRSRLALERLGDVVAEVAALTESTPEGDACLST